MSIFNVLSMIGGLALFLYGMHLMGEGLSKASGGKLESILEKLTSNPVKAVLLGAGVTAVIQSSSATTVMVVGFVNSGIMRLSQAVGIIMGANIGTTATSWILSLTGIEGDNLFVNLLKPSSFSPVLAIIGVVCIMFVKKQKVQDIGKILVGFAILMTGMDAMSSAVEPLADVPQFTQILTMFSNPVLGMLAGLVLTAIIQSSSASVGILQTLAMNGIVNWRSAVFITLGQNIGTCVTALLSGVGSDRNGKRAAVIHLLFNVIGAVLFGVAMYVLFLIFPAWGASTMNSVDISIFHTVFNITCTVVMLPFAEKLVWISGKLVPGSDQTAGELEGSEAKKMAKRLDSRVLGNPLFALATVVREVSVMGHATCQNLELALAAVSEENPQKAQKVYEREKDINSMEKILTEFLVEVDNLSLTEGQQEQVKNLFYTVSDIERAGDHAENIAELAETLSKNSGSFSKKGKADLELISAQTMQSLQIAVESRETGSVKSANAVRVLEQSVDQLEGEMREKHIRRLSKGKCDPESGVIFLDIISNLERISDHAVNIADYVKAESEAGIPAIRI